MLYLLFVFINVFTWSATRFPYHMMFVLFDKNTTGANTGAGTGVRAAQSLTFSAVLYL